MKLLLIISGIFFQMCITQAQNIKSIADNNYLGVILYSDNNHNGKELFLKKMDQPTECPFRVKSIKVMGNYELHGEGELGISRDEANISLEPQKFWLKPSDQPKIAIIYPEPDFKGLPTYLSPFEVVKNQEIKSLRLSPGTMALIKSTKGDIAEICDDINKMTSIAKAIQVKPNKCY